MFGSAIIRHLALTTILAVLSYRLRVADNVKRV